DAVSLHLAVTPETEGIVDRRLLGLLAPHAIFVNTARGALVDEDALAELLEAGAIGGVGLDVLGTEAAPANPPALTAPPAVRPPLASACPVCSSTLSPTTCVSPGRIPTWPETKTKPPAAIACEYGAPWKGAGAASVRMACFSVIPLSSIVVSR